jgi:hypothetical protein
VIGCSSNLIASTLIPPSEYTLSFFGLAPIGIILTILVSLFTILGCEEIRNFI